MTDETLLYRQVHPSWVEKGGLSSQVFSCTFQPSAKDDGMLSCYDGDRFTAEASHQHFTRTHSSYGVLGVTVEEFKSEELPAKDDPEPFEGHILVDYNSHSKGAQKAKAKKMRNIAAGRDWLFKPVYGDDDFYF